MQGGSANRARGSTGCAPCSCTATCATPPRRVGSEWRAARAHLGPTAAAACDAARLAPPPFASLRNEADAPAEELKRSPYPYDCHEPMHPSHPDRPTAASKRKGLPPPVGLAAGTVGSAGPSSMARPTAMPTGPIHITALFLAPDLYELHVESWMRLCDAYMSPSCVRAARRALAARGGHAGDTPGTAPALGTRHRVGLSRS